MATIWETHSVEINAVLGLLVLSTTMKDNHLTTKKMFDPTFIRTHFVSVMSKDCFKFLLSSLRFDNEDSRLVCGQNDKFAAIKDIWEQIIESCRNNYYPGLYLTIDESF